MPKTGAMVEVLLLDGTWTDITDRTYHRDTIKISRGRQDQGTRVDPGSCTLTLNNKQGYFSPRNPLSPLYGLIGRNTPVRVSAVGGDPWLGLPADGPARQRATTPDIAVLDITGDLDVRFDVQPEDWNATTIVELGGKWGATGQKSWHVILNSGFIELFWTADGTTELLSFMALGSIALTPRMSLRVTLDVDNGASGNTARYYAGPTLDGPWTQIGTDQVSAGTTSIFSSTAPLELGDITATSHHNAVARLFGAQIRNGIDGTVVANPDFTAQAASATAFTDAAGRVWTVTTGGLTNRHVRFLGEISAWPARWDVSGGDVYVQVQAAGIMRRLAQGVAPLDSTLRRRIASWPTTVAYWPFEDGSGATQAYSPSPGVLPAAVSGAQMASDDTLGGSDALPTWPQNSAFTCTVPAYATGTSWQVQHVYQLDSAPASYTNMLIIQSTGTVRRWEIAFQAGAVRIHGLDATGALAVDQAVGVGTDIIGDWTRQVFALSESGGTVTWSIQLLVVGVNGGSFSDTYTGTCGRVSDVHQTYIAALDNLRLGHVAVFSDSTAGAFNGADTGFSGEDAVVRYVRLATEEGVPFRVPYGILGTADMGPQKPGSFLDLLEDAQDADVGILYEARDSIALAYRPRVSLYNQTPALALDYATRGEVAPPLEPTEDDTATRNDITVSRPSGSSARATLDSGPLSVQAPPSGVGRYTTSQTVNVQDDDQLPDLASWLLHLGTVDEPRYPAVTVNLAAGPWLTGPAATVDVGDLITITNPPPWLPPGTISLICQGYTETIEWGIWTITYNCTPGSLWQVAVFDDPVLGRADTEDSELAADADSDDTTLSVNTLDGPLWTADPAETPWDITVGGETIRVEAVGASILNAAPWMDDGITGWAAQGTTATVAAVTMPRPDGQTAPVLQITPDGTSASGGAIEVTQTAAGSITPGSSYVVCLWAYSAAGYSDLRPAVDWYDSSAAFLSSGLGSGSAVPAGVWTFLTQTVTAPASASMAQVRARHAGTPATSDVWFAWGIRIMPVAGVQSSPQSMAVSRSRNGISKAQVSGTDVRLATPMILAL